MARIMPALEFRSFHSHRSCENVPNTTRLATLPSHTLAMGAKGNSSKKKQSKRTLMASDDDSVD
jgi:hypothetical protein